MAVKINTLELENVKRVKAVKIEPTQNGLTVIGGNNNQGKTSVLDSIAWALGGDTYKPSKPKREGSQVNPYLHIELSNGIVVERKGANSALKVTDLTGKTSGQRLLDSFINKFALDLPKFMNATDKEKADTLLKIIGVGDQLKKLDDEKTVVYNERLAVGRIATQKQKFADELPQWDNVSAEIISASELIQRQQQILARNGENQRLRDNKTKVEQELSFAQMSLEQAKKAYLEAQAKVDKLQEDVITANKSVEDLQDESTAEIEESINNIESTNAKIRDNLQKEKAIDEAMQERARYADLSTQLDDIAKKRLELLNGAELPLPGLSVEEGKLTFNGQQWDNMSGSQQLIVATSIVRKLNPECGFVLLDKLEQLDLDTLKEFGEWLENENLQAIATRVSKGEECSVFIEDGYSVDSAGERTAESELTPLKMWKEGGTF